MSRKWDQIWWHSPKKTLKKTFAFTERYEHNKREWAVGKVTVSWRQGIGEQFSVAQRTAWIHHNKWARLCCANCMTWGGSRPHLPAPSPISLDEAFSSETEDENHLGDGEGWSQSPSRCRPHGNWVRSSVGWARWFQGTAQRTTDEERPSGPRNTELLTEGKNTDVCGKTFPLGRLLGPSDCYRR